MEGVDSLKWQWANGEAGSTSAAPPAISRFTFPREQRPKDLSTLQHDICPSRSSTVRIWFFLSTLRICSSSSTFCGRLVLADVWLFTDFFQCCNVTNSVVPFSPFQGFFCRCYKSGVLPQQLSQFLLVLRTGPSSRTFLINGLILWEHWTSDSIEHRAGTAKAFPPSFKEPPLHSTTSFWERVAPSTITY